MYWYCLLVVGLFGWQTSLAQVPPDALRRYKAAVQLVQSGSYEKARTELNAIVQGRGPLAAYASYYYALAAYRQKQFGQSRLMLKQLLEQFPDWRKIDDANYLMAAVAMEMSNYEEGVGALQPIRDATIRTQGTRLEQAFLGRITELDRLKQLNKAYPNDRGVGLALVDLIQQTSSDKDDLELSDRLTNRFGVSLPTSRPTTTTSTSATPVAGNRPVTPMPTPTRTSRPKGYYNIALLFPFRLDEFDAEKRLRNNQYVYDLYNGIKLAKTKLQEEGITVNLFAYDVENDANKTLELVNSPAFAQTDLIIGPFYLEPNRIASAYASQSNIILLNPIATNSDLVANQPTAFLAQPSIQQQAHKLADFAHNLPNGRQAAIYFGASRKDSLLAMAYQAELNGLNYQVVDFRKLSGSAQAMATAMQLPAPRPGAPTSSTATVTLSHVFLASSNEEDGSRLLDALNRRHINGPLIATASAFDQYKTGSSTLSRRELYLLYPDFVDNAREPVLAFEEQYLSKRNTIPSVFASQGYDMMLFFGRQLAKNGASFRNRSTLRSDTDDYLMSGFDYSQSNDNQIVPIVKFEEGRFVKIN
jgi:ABC-type branched-subunit amino acid transport system substrate-binding protein